MIYPVWAKSPYGSPPFPPAETLDLGHDDCSVCEAARQMGGMHQTITRLQALEKASEPDGARPQD